MLSRRVYRRMDPDELTDRYRYWSSERADWSDLASQYGNHRVARRAVRRCARQLRRIEAVAAARDIHL